MCLWDSLAQGAAVHFVVCLFGGGFAAYVREVAVTFVHRSLADHRTRAIDASIDGQQA